MADATALMPPLTPLPNFVMPHRQVKLAESAVQSYGGLTTVTEYHLISRQEDVVDSTFMHDKYASPGSGGSGAEDAMVVFTKHSVWSLADEDSDD